MKQEWFVVGLGGERYGLPLVQVDEVVRAARLLRIPQGPPALAGALVLHDESIPVLDLRARFGVPPARLHPRQLFVIGSVAGRRAALVVDSVEGLVELEMDATPGDALPRPPYATGVASDAAGGAVLLVSLDHILSTREASQITDAMTAAQDFAGPPS
jgi:purine-binding chemotaxis protein CheW